MSLNALWRRLPLALTGLALAGVGVSSYLSYTHLGKKTIVCGGLGECDLVNSSGYAYIGGIPVSFLGLALYGALLGAAVLWALDQQDERRPILYWGLALTGAGYAGYLTYVELEILHAICVWCVVSAIILTLSLVLSTAHLLWAPEPEEETAANAAAASSTSRPARGRQQRPSSPR